MSSAEKVSLKEAKLFDIRRSVNFHLRAIFISVPKSGSSSIGYHFRELNPRSNLMVKDSHFTITQVRDLLYFYYLLNRKRNNLFPTDAKKVLSDAELHAQATETFKQFFKFASVRNPWQRVVSLYDRIEGRWGKDNRKKYISFDQFCEQLRFASDTCEHPTRCANQLDWMIDETGALAVDYVLRLEKFEEGLQEIKERTNGRLDLKPDHRNMNPQSRSASYRNLYTEKTKNHVAELFKRDIEFFGYDF
ncbi:MAG: sulfotransferase family 2 domain-containing protein [Rhodospirillales bacterium]|nr:sulfotransferase family 2 domain-containing protein [Rhodospirillales bacterium]